MFTPWHNSSTSSSKPTNYVLSTNKKMKRNHRTIWRKNVECISVSCYLRHPLVICMNFIFKVFGDYSNSIQRSRIRWNMYESRWFHWYSLWKVQWGLLDSDVPTSWLKIMVTIVVLIVWNKWKLIRRKEQPIICKEAWIHDTVREKRNFDSFEYFSNFSPANRQPHFFYEWSKRGAPRGGITE